MSLPIAPTTEYTQQYIEGPAIMGSAPSGLQPVSGDLPGIVPTGITQATGETATSLGPRAPAGARGQYTQRYPEGYAVGMRPYVAGLRGRARTFRHYPDPLIEPTLGPILETNRGYPFIWTRSVVRSYKPGQEFQSVSVTGKTTRAPHFRARPINEINASAC